MYFRIFIYSFIIFLFNTLFFSFLNMYSKEYAIKTNIIKIYRRFDTFIIYNLKNSKRDYNYSLNLSNEYLSTLIIEWK